MRLNNMGFAHIANAEHQTRHTVAMTDDRIPRIEQCLSPFFRPRQFGKDNANHKCLNEYAQYALDAHGEDGFRTFRCGVAITIACKYKNEQYEISLAIGLNRAHMSNDDSPIVCCVSTENRKLETKLFTSVTHGMCVSLSVSSPYMPTRSA